MSALVIAAGGGIGDALLATPLVRALRARYGDIVALVGPGQRDVVVDDPDVQDVWTDDAPFWTLVRRTRERSFAAAFVTWATARSAALPFAAGVPVRVGQSRRLYSALFTVRIARRSDSGDRTSHWTQVLLDLGRAVGCDVADATPTFVVTDAARASIATLLAGHDVAGAYVVLHPTRGIAAAARARWPIEPFAELARRLAAKGGVRVVISGSRDDRELAQEIADASGAVSLAGLTTLGEFGALAAAARTVVAMDSGPMHVAAAVGAPTVGIFALASDEPDRWAPLGPRTAVVRATYPCPPAHRKETCPNFACIAALDVGRVLAAVDRITPRTRA